MLRAAGGRLDVEAARFPITNLQSWLLFTVSGIDCVYDPLTANFRNQ